MTKGPESFLWGVATTACQIEGAYDADGKGPLIGDAFTRLPGQIVRGDTGDITCDRDHRVEDDLDPLGWLGVNRYRFSVSWPRVPARQRSSGGSDRVEPVSGPAGRP